MAFDAGAVIGRIALDTKKWVSGMKIVEKTSAVAKSTFKALKTGVTVAAGAAATAFAASVVQADKWQKSFANVSTLVDTAAVDVQGMSKELLGLDGSLGSAAELTDGLYQALSASVEPSQAVKFVGESAQFAKAALVDTNTAVDVITTGLNAYGLEADKAGSISDKLFTVIKTGKTTGDELASTIGSSIPLAANMGISFDELGASIAIMTRQGISAAESTTQFNAVVNGFLKPSDNMAASLAEMGFASGEAAIESLGFKGALDKVAESTGGSKEELAKLFGNTRALRGALALTGKGAADFDEVLGQVTNSAGATQTAFEKQELTFETLKNQMGTISILAGNVGKTFVDELAVGASEAAGGMIDFILSGRAAEPIGKIIGGISGSFTALKGALTPIVNSIIPLFNDLGAELQETFLQVTGKSDTATGAFSILSAGINVAALTAKVLIKMVTGIINNIGNLVSAIRESGQIVGSFFDFITGKKSWDEVKDQAGAAGKAINEFGIGVKDFYGEIFSTVKEGIQTFSEDTSTMTDQMTLSYKAASQEASASFVSSYDSMITGQENFVGKVLEGNDAVEASFQQASATIIAGNTMTTRQFIDNFERVRVASMAVSAEQINGQKELQEEYEKTAEMMLTTFGPVLNELGAALAGAEDGWESLRKAALGSIADIVEGFAEQWALQSAAALVVGNVKGAIGFGAASVAAKIGAGAIRALKTGGVARGPTLVGENGPEVVDIGQPSRVFTANDSQRMGNDKMIQVNPIYIVNNQQDAELVNRKLGVLLQNVVRKI